MKCHVADRKPFQAASGSAKNGLKYKQKQIKTNNDKQCGMSKNDETNKYKQTQIKINNVKHPEMTRQTK